MIEVPFGFHDAEVEQPATPRVVLALCLVDDDEDQQAWVPACFLDGEWWDVTQENLKCELKVEAWAELPVFPFDQLRAAREARARLGESRGLTLAEAHGNEGGME